jgi:hypothetical protein
MKRRRIHYMIQPKGSESWIETTKQAMEALKKSHGDKLTIDRKEYETSRIVWLSIEP